MKIPSPVKGEVFGYFGGMTLIINVTNEVLCGDNFHSISKEIATPRLCSGLAMTMEFSELSNNYRFARFALFEKVMLEWR